MGLDPIRRVARPGHRTARSTFISVLLMAAVALGMVAMHDPGVDHAAHGGTSATAQASHRAEHADERIAGATAPMVAMASAATAAIIGCDDGCMRGLLDCAAVAIACAMMIAFAVVLALAARPAMFGRLRDGGGPVLAFLRDTVTAHLRPDLHVLSISRT